MTDIKLKPCPFCGSNNLYFHGMDGPAHEWHFISCDDCHASIGLHVGFGDPNEDQLTELSKKWNTRTKETEDD